MPLRSKRLHNYYSLECSKPMTDDELQDLYDTGWELVTVAPIVGDVGSMVKTVLTYHFKRRVIE